MIVQTKPGHFYDFRNIMEIIFHDTDKSITIRPTHSPETFYVWFKAEEDMYTVFKEKWIDYVERENESRTSNIYDRLNKSN